MISGISMTYSQSGVIEMTESKLYSKEIHIERSINKAQQKFPVNNLLTPVCSHI